MADIWTMNEEGEFELAEPYATMLEEARYEATNGWTKALVEYLAQRTPYTSGQLAEKLLEYNEKEGDRNGVFEHFVTQALIGEL